MTQDGNMMAKLNRFKHLGLAGNAKENGHTLKHTAEEVQVFDT